MYNSWFVRTSDNNLTCFYFNREKGICLRKYEQNRWQKQVVLVSDARESFTVNVTDDDNIFIFCQDKQGNVLYCSDSKGLWQLRVIFKAQSSFVSRNMLFCSLMSLSHHILVYNLPDNEEKAQYIAIQKVDAQGKWDESSRLDKFSSFFDKPFVVRHISKDHAVIFYQTKGIDTTLGYRELTTEKYGDFVKVHSTSCQISDTSFLTTDSSIHMLYVIKSIFSSQLIYRKRDVDGFSNPIVLWETQKIEKCLISIVSSIIYITFSINGMLHICSSEDGGASFSRPQRYRGEVAQNLAKSAYVSNISMNEREFFCHELYTDSNNPWNTQVIDNLYPDFFPVTLRIVSELPLENDKKQEMPDAVKIAAAKPQAQVQNEYVHLDPDMEFFNRSFSIKPSSDNLIDSTVQHSIETDMLKKKIRELSLDNEEKLFQIRAMSGNFNAQREDYAVAEMNYKIRLNELEEEIKSLKSLLTSSASKPPEETYFETSTPATEEN